MWKSYNVKIIELYILKNNYSEIKIILIDYKIKIKIKNIEYSFI